MGSRPSLVSQQQRQVQGCWGSDATRTSAGPVCSPVQSSRHKTGARGELYENAGEGGEAGCASRRGIPRAPSVHQPRRPKRAVDLGSGSIENGDLERFAEIGAEFANVYFDRDRGIPRPRLAKVCTSEIYIGNCNYV